MQAANPSASKNSFLFIPNISNNFTIFHGKVDCTISRTCRVATLTMMHHIVCAHVTFQNFDQCCCCVHVLYYIGFRVSVNNYFLALQFFTQYTVRYTVILLFSDTGAVCRPLFSKRYRGPPTRPIYGIFSKPLRCQIRPGTARP